MYVPAKLRKEVICQCHDTRMAGHFCHWKTLKKVKKYFNWGGLNKASMCNLKDGGTDAQGRNVAL